jgi:hypothetical protein
MTTSQDRNPGILAEAPVRGIPFGILVVGKQNCRMDVGRIDGYRQ